METPFVRSLVPAYIGECESLLQTTSRRRALEAIRWQSRVRSAGTFCFDGTALTYGATHSAAKPHEVNSSKIQAETRSGGSSERGISTALSAGLLDNIRFATGVADNVESTTLFGGEERCSARTTPEKPVSGEPISAERPANRVRPTTEQWVDDAGEPLRRGPPPQSPLATPRDVGVLDSPSGQGTGSPGLTDTCRRSHYGDQLFRQSTPSNIDGVTGTRRQSPCAAEDVVSAMNLPTSNGVYATIANDSWCPRSGRPSATSDRPQKTTREPSSVTARAANRQSKVGRRLTQRAAMLYGSQAARLRLAARLSNQGTSASSAARKKKKKMTVSMPKCSYEPVEAYEPPARAPPKQPVRKMKRSQPKYEEPLDLNGFDILGSPSVSELGVCLGDSAIDAYVASVLIEAAQGSDAIPTSPHRTASAADFCNAPGNYLSPKTEPVGALNLDMTDIENVGTIADEDAIDAYIAHAWGHSSLSGACTRAEPHVGEHQARVAHICRKDGVHREESCQTNGRSIAQEVSIDLATHAQDGSDFGSLSDLSPTAAMQTYGLSADVAEYTKPSSDLRPIASCLQEIDLALADLQKELAREDFI